MISPTGLGVRNDPAGFGYFDAPRGSKRHEGTDYLCNPGIEVVFPFDAGKVLRLSYPYGDTRDYGGIYARGLERGKLLYFFMWYFQPRDDVLLIDFKQGDVLGVAQDVTARYADQEMQPHVHLEIDKIDSELLLEVTP